MKALVLFRMHFSPIYYHSQTCSYALFINPYPILSLEAAQFNRKFQLDSTLCSRKFPHQSRLDALTLSKIISWGEKMFNQPSKFPQKETNGSCCNLWPPIDDDYVLNVRLGKCSLPATRTRIAFDCEVPICYLLIFNIFKLLSQRNTTVTPSTPFHPIFVPYLNFTAVV